MSLKFGKIIEHSLDEHILLIMFFQSRSTALETIEITINKSFFNRKSKTERKRKSFKYVKLYFV